MITGAPSNFRYEHDVDWAPTLNLTSSVATEDLKKARKDKQLENLQKMRASKNDSAAKLPNSSSAELIELSSSDEESPTLIEQHQHFPTPTIGEEMTSNFDADNHVKLEHDEIMDQMDIASSSSSDCDQSESLPEPTEECVNCHKNPNVQKKAILVETSCQTDDDVLAELEICRQENEILRMELKFYQAHVPNDLNPLDEDSLKNNASLLKFYTGFATYSSFKMYFEFSSTFVSPDLSSEKGLSPLSEFLLAMMKLRLNMSYKDLALRFKLDEATQASTIFEKWVVGMYRASKELIVWSGKKFRFNVTPFTFVCIYGDRVAAVIDCFELMIVRPPNSKAQAQTWSEKKGRNTIKYLLSVSPKCTINFISNSWGGLVSNEHIVEESGFLKCLEPGDMVMTDDEGFSIDDLLAPLDCSIAEPTRPLPRTKYIAEKRATDIADLKKSAKRVIELLQNQFQILADTVSVDLLIMEDGNNVPLIDYIVTICCGLVNFSPNENFPDVHKK